MSAYSPNYQEVERFRRNDRTYYRRGGSQWLVKEQGQYWPISESLNQAINDSIQRMRDPFYDPRRDF